MPDLTELQRQRAQIDAQIAAYKTAAVAQVCQLMETLGVTFDDLGMTRPAAPAPAPVKKRPVKFKDEIGNTWTGVGQRPRWLKARMAAGASLEQFLIR